jgi:ribonucleotide reductase beta subunit family protein with ferritin-like domain
MATYLSQLTDYQYIFFYLNALTVEEKLKHEWIYLLYNIFESLITGKGFHCKLHMESCNKLHNAVKILTGIIKRRKANLTK